MPLTAWLLLACLAAWLTKLAGYLVPASWLERPRMTRVAGALTIGLLAALTAMNTFGGGTGLVLDARIGSLLAAGLALQLRVPFLPVVLLGALAAALLRWLGVA